MALVRMDIQTLAVGEGPIPSLLVLRSRSTDGTPPIQLPIRIGKIEATSISMGLDEAPHGRPMTHDLLKHVINALGATLTSIAIVDVRGTIFFAELMLVSENGTHINLDCRPSDAIALAVRMGVPILVEERVLNAATLPDFKGVEAQEKELDLARFHDFVESLSPADFSESE